MTNAEYIKRWKLPNELDINIQEYLSQTHKRLLQLLELQETDLEDFLRILSFEESLQKNETYYYELNEGYEVSYANPRYTSTKLPNSVSDEASAFYFEVIQSLPFVTRNDKEMFDMVCEKFQWMCEGMISKEDLASVFSQFEMDHKRLTLNYNFESNYDVNNSATRVLLNSDFDDIRYLFKYGIPISKNEIDFAKMMNQLTEDDINNLAHQMVSGYLKGFKTHNKDPKGRKNVRIVLQVGLERIGVRICELLQKQNLRGYVGQLIYKDVIAQAIDDHAVININDQEASYYDVVEKAYQYSLEDNKMNLSQYQGNIIMVTFGQLRANAQKYTAFRDRKHMKQKQLDLANRHAFESFVPKCEVSYTGMAFPVSEITNDNYAEIFKAIMDINMMDPSNHEKMHECLIRKLDQATHVRIEGFCGNETKLTIALPKIENPNSETNFVNCGADVNIPVGEVYTSPQLQGSNGTIHLKQIRLAKMQFYNVRIDIKNGYASNYRYDRIDDSNILRDLVFKGHERLPIGEFALGTNTYAYAKTKALGILHTLHTLIYEKVGLHIALGDTCFAWAEEAPLYASDGKQVVAKDNERSILRKEDPSKAYLNLHYDLTIPYDEIGLIESIDAFGNAVKIVENGRFKLECLKSLNDALND